MTDYLPNSSAAIAEKRPSSIRRTLLIDGDVLCYRIGFSAEEVINWADKGSSEETLTVHVNASEVKARLKAAIYALKEKLNADWAVVCVTRDTENFRKAILPTYKENRTSSRKPIALKMLRQFLIDHFGALHHPKLEADDILGILQTGGAFGPEDGSLLGETTIVSSDKDLLGVPGKHYRLNDERLETVTELGAEEWHATQTLAGDITDNYAGCPGVGMERALKAINEGYGWNSYEHVFKSGPRKGLVETRWEQFAASSLWEIIVTHYLRAGLTEADALVQARCAWMLRAENWNNATQEITLWEH